MSDWVFFRRVLIVAAVLALAALIWQLSQALLLFFGAVLVGILLDGAASFFTRHTPVSRGPALALTIALVVIVLGGVIALFGPHISAQITDLTQRLPGAIDSFEQRFQLGDVSGKLVEQVQSNSGSLLFQITSMAAFILSVAGNTVLVLVAGGFLAAQPELYRRGALKLVPPEQRQIVGETLDDAGAALKQWLLGQFLSMAIVGTLTGLGLWLVGVPAPLALGLVAATAEFIPIIGPIVGAVPALLLAASMTPATVAWTIGVFVVVQQLESNMITPLIQRRMVSLPPVVTVFAILCFGLLFGPLGLLFATPLAVLSYVLTTRLYIRELLEEPAKVPGEKEAKAAAARSRSSAG
jgi:predicted PurR-regulated permease PerM